MEDASYYTKQQQFNEPTPSKFYARFLYKALIVTIFLVILTLFRSQAPEFINQTLNTRGWEFLHLLFVGIAVSYGLFSRRNNEPNKENKSSYNGCSNFDNAQSYISRLLQVSSVFGDEGDSPTGSWEKFQTWNNQYYRNEPVVVVAEENSVLEKEQIKASSKATETPLMLPVRRLKFHSLEDDIREPAGVPGLISRSSSNSGSKRFFSDSGRSRGTRIEGLDYEEQEEKVKDHIVLPSPIPWRSRSGRMEIKEEDNDLSDSILSPPVEEFEYIRSIRPQVSRSSSQPNSTHSSPKLSPSSSLSSPKKINPAASFSLETQGKSAEDFVRKRSFYRSPPPPPPPPPPPRTVRRVSSMKPRYVARDDDEDDVSVVKKDLKRSFTSEPRELNMNARLSAPRSVRTIRSNDYLARTRKEQEFEDGIKTKEGKTSKQVKDISGRRVGGYDQLSMEMDRGQSFPYLAQPTYMKFPDKEKEEMVDKLEVESDQDLETVEERNNVMGGPYDEGAAAGSKNEGASTGIAGDGGPDVDKKADEFIAKFREQIRLQRIDSIKRSSAQASRNASR